MKSVNLKSVTGMSYAISEIRQRRHRDAEARPAYIVYIDHLFGILPQGKKTSCFF